MSDNRTVSTKPIETDLSTEIVINAFYAAIENGDFDTVAALYAEDLALWQSSNLTTVGRTEGVATLQELGARWTSRYRIIERYYIGDQVAQRHELTLANSDGTIAHRLQSATFLTVHGGQIHRLDEYLDSRDIAALSKDLAQVANP